MSYQFISALRLTPNLLSEPALAPPVVQAVKQGLTRLSKREATVLRLHFGLSGRSHDLAAVARLTGLTIPTVRRVRRLAFKKLRWLTADLGTRSGHPDEAADALRAMAQSPAFPTRLQAALHPT